MLLPLIAAASLLLRCTGAVFADEAWNVDYHYPLFGAPKEDTTFFHQPNPESKASLVYTLSEKGVLGAINPRDGAIVWRQRLGQDAASPNASFLRTAQGDDVVVSGAAGRVSSWSAADGRLAWEADTEGELVDVEILELPDGKETGVKDAIALSRGPEATLRRLDGATGHLKWQARIDGSDVPYQVSASSTEVFAVLLHKTMLGYIKIRVVSFDPVTGMKKDEYTLSSDSELASADSIISVGANSASPIIAWTDASHTVLKINVVGKKAVSSFDIASEEGNNVKRIRLHAPTHANSLAHFLVHYETASSHWADVFHINVGKGAIEKAYGLPRLDGNGAFSTSTSDANVYFTRITREEVLTVSSASHGILGRWKVEGFGVVAGPDEIVEPVHAVSELSVKSGAISAIRSTVLLSTGDWLLLKDGTPMWQRPESLADTVAATFATPSAVENLAHELELEAHSNVVAAYIHRIKRHVEDLQRLPAALSSLPQRMIRGFIGTTGDGAMGGDSFGFHKVIACVTEKGRLIAIDAGSPDRLLWSRRVRTEAGELWQPRLEAPAAGVLTLKTSSGAPIQVYNATNGHVASHTASTAEATEALAIQYELRDNDLEATRAGTADSGSLWHFTPTEGERILSVTPRVDDPVASIGKVLGDRKVLYKYLDSNLALVATIADATNTATIYVLNTVSGIVLYSSSHVGVDLGSEITTVISENWFAYSFTAEASDVSPKGHQLVVGEMFESLVPNDRGPLNGASNFSSLHSEAAPFTLSHTYQIPEAISKLAVTKTKQGITSRQLLAVIPASNSIVGIPYSALDPRRPINRDPTKEEQSEGLVRYAPNIEFDGRWHLNHQREVLGIREVVTSPALVESTSIVFAYGLDLFGTRLSPSFSFDILGKDFNKFQMLATVAALAVTTFVVGPLVTRKQVNARWRFVQ